MNLESVGEIEFTLSCSEINFPDRRYRYNPQIKLYIKEQGDFTLYDQTEIFHGTKTPHFQQKFIIPFNTGVVMNLKFELLDSQSSEDQKFLGQTIITTEEILRTPNENKIVEIVNLTDKVCDLIMNWKKVSSPSKDLLLTIEGVNFKYQTPWFSKPDIKPFFQVGRFMSEDEFLCVYESNTLEEAKNPRWPAFRMKSSNLIKSNIKSPVKVKILYYENNLERLFGEVLITFDQVLNCTTSFPIYDKVKHKNIGSVRVKCQTLEKIACNKESASEEKLNVLIGIDFSDSQKRIEKAQSTHFKTSEDDLTQYQAGLNGLFNLLYNLNGSQGIPMYGFGGIKASSSSKSRKDNEIACFPLNGNSSDPKIQSLDGAIEAYNQNILNNLGGQSNLSEIIQKAISIAAYNQLQDSKEYVVLVLLTDGVIHDIENTLNSLIEAANVPLSVIMIGMGDGDFESFENLDSQLGLFETARRDYVSFIVYRDYEEDLNKLKNKLVQEIPEQILEYVETEPGLREESKEKIGKVPTYLKDNLYGGGREYIKARKLLDGYMKRLK